MCYIELASIKTKDTKKKNKKTVSITENDRSHSLKSSVALQYKADSESPCSDNNTGGSSVHKFIQITKRTLYLVKNPYKMEMFS